ncbi:UDP-glucuronate 4-epimerase 3 [Spatholobus suberectus]|nr:UDP-glucuronate 4-epimerase 3 [Spatholobus suberectus]
MNLSPREIEARKIPLHPPPPPHPLLTLQAHALVLLLPRIHPLPLHPLPPVALRLPPPRPRRLLGRLPLGEARRQVRPPHLRLQPRRPRHGAAGFVGTHVSLALKRRGDGVLGLDNFNRYYDPNLKRARQRILDRAGVFVVDGDVNDAALLRKLFDVVPFTHVMHLAAQAGVRYAMQNPGSYVHSNIAGFVNLLETCKSANPQPAVVWASSSSVYGLNSKVPFSEKDRTDQPASLYAATKKAGEEIAHSYNHIYGLSITGLRFFTVYGPWGRPDMAYFFFTKDILKGKQITIFESPDGGTVARDFTYIDDIVKGCLGALDTAKKSTGSGGKKKGPAQFRVFNLGNTSPVPVSELVAILEKLLKVKAKKKVHPMPTNGDVKFTHANISLAHRDLGYRPTTDLETGLRKFVKWYLEFYSKKSSW